MKYENERNKGREGEKKREKKRGREEWDKERKKILLFNAHGSSPLSPGALAFE